MSNTTVYVETFKCPNCPYKIQQDPYEPGRMQRLFKRMVGIQDGDCPACFSGKNPQRIVQRSKLEKLSGIDLSQLGKRVVADDVVLETTQEEESDAEGNIVMVESSQYRDKLINDNGTPRFVQEPVMTPKMRPIEKAKVDELKLQRDQSLDKLEAIAVKEVVDIKDSPDEPLTRV